jgi:hypothetical protein
MREVAEYQAQQGSMIEALSGRMSPEGMMHASPGVWATPCRGPHAAAAATYQGVCWTALQAITAA